MIYKLQRKFILICTISILVVISLIFCVNLVLSISSMNKNIDMLADKILEGGGRFPGYAEGKPPHDSMLPSDGNDFNFITSETPFSTRHFTVFFNNEGNPERVFTESIYSITDDKAIEYASKIIEEGKDRGWIAQYRYKVHSGELGKSVVFVDGSVSRSLLMQSGCISGFVLLTCAALVLILIFLLSKRVVKPIAESYEKQKQFVTDVNHELKTPLTLILTNLDIAESELGKNEWLEDIRSEGHRMTTLVDQLVSLSRMDEDGQPLNLSEIDLSNLTLDISSEFEPLIQSKNKKLTLNIDTGIRYNCDEALLRRLISTLLDNAAKYCDANGEILITLRRDKKIILTIENTYASVGELELNRLFDRFYRADKARHFTGGYGIGLSMAKIIVEKHKGSISAYKKDDSHIGFKVLL